jgi:hypothetical protein
MMTSERPAYLQLDTSRLSHIMAPRDPAASGSVAVFGLCGVVTWESAAHITAQPVSNVCSLCTREAGR